MILNSLLIVFVLQLISITQNVEGQNKTIVLNKQNLVQSLRRYRDDKVHRSKGRQIINWDRRWPNGVVHFEISPEFNGTTRELIFDAMRELTKQTCITFRKRSKERDFIYFQMKFGDGCHTHAGRQGGLQILNLDSQRCLQHGKIMHELLHVLGFHHEHQRPDRDNYINILWDNIKPEDRIQLKKLEAPVIYLLGFPYDYGSILHYGNISFYLSIDREKPILSSRHFAPDMGQRISLSTLDVEKVNILYDCNLKSKTKNTKSNEILPTK